MADKYLKLRRHELFNIDALKEGLAAPDRVKDRLSAAVTIFAS